MDLLEQYQTLEHKLESLIGEFKFSAAMNLKLERITYLLALLGNPQDAFAIIHVGGTSGKGSTSSYTAEILEQAGYKTGLFLSPYLQVINEICIIQGCPAKTSELLACYQDIEPYFLEVAQHTQFGRPSYFEVKLALSLMLFKQHKIDVAVIEVGLGGRLDASNALATDVSVLVSVGLDHTEILGNTIEAIAREKVDIIKQNGSVVCGFSQASTRAIAQVTAQARNADIFFINQDFSYDYNEGKMAIKTTQFDSDNIKLAMTGAHQAHNAACAVVAYQAFCQKRQQPFSKAAVLAGLAQAQISGRSEVIQENPTVILDGAHNPDKLAAFCKRLAELSTAPIIIFALKKGRDVNAEIFPLIAQLPAKKLIITRFYNKGIWESVPAEALMQAIQAHHPKASQITAIEDPIIAIQTALAEAQADDVIAVTGSLFLVGDIRSYWQPKAQLLQYIENGCRTNTAKMA